MVRKYDAYLYGMSLYSTIHRLKGPYPPADTYREIAQTFQVPGGEIANAAILLARLGLKVHPEGTLLGTQTQEPLLRHYRKWGLDCSGLKLDPAFEGWKDLVLVDNRHRTVFGWFAHRFSNGGGRKWASPKAKAIQQAKVAAIDPYLRKESEKAALLCHKAGVPYVTLDCPPDSVCHRFSRVNILSRYFLNGLKPKTDLKTLMARYRARTKGLTVFTFGTQAFWYARPQGPIRQFVPYEVKVSGTLGAGDAFRAGMVYGLWRGWEDEPCVRFAAGLAACVCRRFPAALYPPSLREVFQLTGKIK